MPDFISKLQYKNYEKGEFSDEKVRGLDETIQLIKNFPWTKQRGVDVQLTGPSVTIQNEYAEYLKTRASFSTVNSVCIITTEMTAFLNFMNLL